MKNKCMKNSVKFPELTKKTKTFFQSDKLTYKIYICYNTCCPTWSTCGGYGEAVNTADCGSVMRGFEPHYSPHFLI